MVTRQFHHDGRPRRRPAGNGGTGGDADVGFVQLGQRAAVTVEAFPFTRRGLIEGTVRTLSADAVADGRPDAANPRAGGSPVTLARITLDATQLDVRGRAVQLSAGMAVTAEVKTGRRTVLDDLRSPIDAAVRETGRKR